MLQSPAPGAAGEECLLLVHIRRVVGQVTYRTCEECAEGVITGVIIDASFRDSGLGTRALSHLRSRYPGVTWRATDGHRLTRDLLHRMRIPRAAADDHCSHLRSAAVARSAG
ncbi:N-acetyltransferase [Streptomyces pimonensis]|uniref:N-acetyltransferase n=1 Tax=Streptomyces pimonensis TaxID=2860288 RepID=UPI0035286A92